MTTSTTKKVRNETWAKLSIITVTKKAIISIFILDSNTSVSFGNLFIDDWY